MWYNMINIVYAQNKNEREHIFMKKTVISLIAAALCLSLSAGCSKPADKPADTQAPVTDASAQTTGSSAVTSASDAAVTSVSSSSSEEEAPDDSPEQSESSYRVLVIDSDSEPVEGATVQFCSDDECVLGVTDASGIAEFDFPEGKYEVHILKVPEGYVKDKTVYETENSYGTLTILLGREE